MQQIVSIMAKNKIYKKQSTCSVKDVLDVIGGKWAMPIIYHLSKGKMRFKEMERSIEGINTRMLVKELKNLEANGIITKNLVYNLNNETLKLPERTSSSNEVLNDGFVEILHADGHLLLMECWD